MASKYTFLKFWANSFIAALNKLKATDDYTYTYRPNGPLGRRVSSLIYAGNVKIRDAQIKDVLKISATLAAEFQKNKVPSSEYGPIVAGLDQLMAKTDLTVPANVTNIINLVKSYLL